jgi:hypothetical protein
VRNLKGCPHESAERTVGIFFVQNVFGKKIDLKSWKIVGWFERFHP